MSSKSLLMVVALFSISSLSLAHAFAIPLDLNSFTADPATAVSIAPDGFSAELSEDSWYAPVTLGNWNLFIPSDARSLSFDYELVVGADNEDYFDFYFEDPTIPTFSDGGFQGRYGGSLSFDVTAFSGETLPVIFGLMYGWDDLGYDSTLTIANVQVNAVPEPCTLLLFGAGIVGLAGFRKKKAV